MRKSRKRSGRKYPRRALWIARRNAAFARAGDYCEVSGAKLVGRAHVVNPMNGEVLHTAECWERAADHIYPERFVRRFCISADPHVLENLIVVTPALHAKKTAVEWRIFRGDLVGYRQELNRLGFAPELLERAMKAILASVKP